MKFESTVRYPGDLAATTALLLDPGYLEFRLRKLGIEAVEQSVETRDGAPRISVKASVPSSMVPASYRRFVPPNLRIHLIELWQPEAGDRSPTGTMTVEVEGLPARASASFRLDATADGTERVYSGDVTASIPLVGRKLESAAVSALDRVVRAEQEAASEYLAR